MAPQPNTLNNADTPTKNIRKRGGQKRRRGTGFRAGAGTGGNMNVPGVNTSGLSAKDAIAFSGELHQLLKKYGIGW